MSHGELSFSEPTYQCSLGNSAKQPTKVPWGAKVSAGELNLPTNVPWGTNFQRTYVPMSHEELSFSEPTNQCSLGK